MVGRLHDEGALLLEGAKKKPHLKQLLESIPDLSYEEIDALPERPWIIKGMKYLKTRGNVKDMTEYWVKKGEELAKKLAPQWVKDNTPEHDCQVYEWIGDDWDLPYGGTGQTAGLNVGVKAGDLFLFDPLSGKLSYEHITTRLSQHTMVVFARSTRLIGVANYMKYRELQRDATNRIYAGEHVAPPFLPPHPSQIGITGREVAGGSFTTNPNRPTERIFTAGNFDFR